MTSPTSPTPQPPVCAKPGCDKAAAPANATGRPPIYCGPQCRPTSQRPRPGGVVVEIDHAPATGRPVGPVWTVTLRRAHTNVTVADGIGRFQAEDLAQRIAVVLGADTITRPSTARKPS